MILGDESGLSADEKVCVVAGFVGSADQWDSFDAQWTGVLTEFEVPLFHAMDFFAWRTDSNGEIVRESPYQGWTEADDFEFIDSLLRTTEDAGLFKAGTAINLSLWLELTVKSVSRANKSDETPDVRPCVQFPS
jgi:hypothetical protein